MNEAAKIKIGNKHLARDVAWVEKIKLNGNKFDMGEWGERSDCGTTACFGGWLALSPGGQRSKLATWRDHPEDSYFKKLRLDGTAMTRRYALSVDEFEFLFTQWFGSGLGKAALKEALARVRTLLLWRELTGRHFDYLNLGG